MSIPSGLLAHIRGEVVTIAWCWKVTRLDSVVMGFTTHVEPISFDSVTYEAATGFLASSIDNIDGLAVDNLSITGVLDSEAIVPLDIDAGKYDGAALEIFFVCYADLTLGRALRFVGTIGNIQSGRISYTAEQRGLTQPLSQNRGVLTSVQCRAILGDAKCGINLSLYAKTGTVGASPTNRSFVDTGRTEPDGWWAGGNITITSGASSGLKMEIKRSTAAGAIELLLPVFYGLVAGDTYSMTPGCNHLVKVEGAYTGDCIVKFNIENPAGNAINFRGEPEIPGTDRITQFGGRT